MVLMCVCVVWMIVWCCDLLIFLMGGVFLNVFICVMDFFSFFFELVSVVVLVVLFMFLCRMLYRCDMLVWVCCMFLYVLFNSMLWLEILCMCLVVVLVVCRVSIFIVVLIMIISVNVIRIVSRLVCMLVFFKMWFILFLEFG